jgi:hypothetical protein
VRKCQWNFGFVSLVLLSTTSCSHVSNPEINGPTHPVAVFPVEIELGQRERGEVAIASFTLANRGGAELVLEDFQSNCSCSGIERLQGNEFVRLDVLRVKPGEEVELRMRVSVRGAPVGARARNGVRFRTNDPDKPTGQIDAVINQVTGGVFTVPESVVIGSVKVGTKVRHVFEVRDDAIEPRILERVASSQDRVKVRILDKSEHGDPAGSVHGGVCIAYVEVLVDTSSPGNIDSGLTLLLAGSPRTPDQLRVLGRVVGPVDLSPSVLVLPRSSPDGPIYSANCLLRSTDGKPLTVSVDACPQHLSVQLPPSDREATPVTILAVKLDPKLSALASEDRNQPIRLRCRSAEVESVIELRVLTMP